MLLGSSPRPSTLGLRKGRPSLRMRLVEYISLPSSALTAEIGYWLWVRSGHWAGVRLGASLSYTNQAFLVTDAPSWQTCLTSSGFRSNNIKRRSWSSKIISALPQFSAIFGYRHRHGRSLPRWCTNHLLPVRRGITWPDNPCFRTGCEQRANSRL